MLQPRFLHTGPFAKVEQDDYPYYIGQFLDFKRQTCWSPSAYQNENSNYNSYAPETANTRREGSEPALAYANRLGRGRSRPKLINHSSPLDFVTYTTSKPPPYQPPQHAIRELSCFQSILSQGNCEAGRAYSLISFEKQWMHDICMLQFKNCNSE